MALKIVASLLVAACASVAAQAGIVTILPAGWQDVGATPAVVISFEQDAAHRLLVRYQAPPDVAHLDFLLVDELQSRVDACLLVRGARAAATMPKGRRQDDPYGCGVALQLLGHARLHANAATAAMPPLDAWGALHRAHPQLDVAGFADFFDANGAPTMRTLLLEPNTPFAATYRADLGALLPLRESTGEPASQQARMQIAFNLMGIVDQADCNATGFSLNAAKGEFVLDPRMHCKALPDGGRLTTLAGVRVVAQPRAAWRAVQGACASGGRVEAGFEGHAPVVLACPTPMPALAPQVVLPDDVLARLGLSIRPVAAASN